MEDTFQNMISMDRKAKLNDEFKKLKNDYNFDEIIVTNDTSVSKFKDIYQYVCAIGQGGFGMVIAVKERLSKQLYAIKV